MDREPSKKREGFRQTHVLYVSEYKSRFSGTPPTEMRLQTNVETVWRPRIMDGRVRI